MSSSITPSSKQTTIKLSILLLLSTPSHCLPTTPSTIKSNKLRKLICNKQLKSLKVTWTEFKEAVDDLLEEKKIKEGEDTGEGGINITLTERGGSSEALEKEKSRVLKVKAEGLERAVEVSRIEGIMKGEDDGTTTKDDSGEKKSSGIHLEFLQPHIIKMEIPTSLAGHLLKNHSKKIGNIESSTKTKIKVVGDTRTSNYEGTVNLEISSDLSISRTAKQILDKPDGVNDEGPKRTTAAKYFIDKMATASLKNPDRFTGKPQEQKVDGLDGNHGEEKNTLDPEVGKGKRNGKEFIPGDVTGVPGKKKARKFY